LIGGDHEEEGDRNLGRKHVECLGVEMCLCG